MTIDGIDYDRCPVAAVDRRLAAGAFALVGHYRRGFLPGGGGVLDQDERDLQMIEAIEAVLAELAAEERAERER